MRLWHGGAGPPLPALASAPRLRSHHLPRTPRSQVCAKAPAQEQYSSQNLAEIVHCFIALGEAPRLRVRWDAWAPGCLLWLLLAPRV